MPEAICIICGAEKPNPWEICKSCKFDPRIDDASLVKSVYLSTGRFDEEYLKIAYKDDLARFGGDLKLGRDLEYDPVDIFRLSQQLKSIRKIEWYMPWIAVMKFLSSFSLKIFILFISLFSIMHIFKIIR